MPQDKKALKRRKAINIAASLADAGVPFNNETMSPDVMAAYLAKRQVYGRTNDATKSPNAGLRKKKK